MRRYTVLYRRNGVLYKLCKVMFGSDGSYYVTCPYHPHDRAFVFVAAVTYAKMIETIPVETMLEVATLDDDDRRLKLSHHPDGFVQFSGDGVTSGKDDAGGIKGIGVDSWPLDDPTLGPSFGLVIFGVDSYETTSTVGVTDVIFDASRIERVADPFCLVVEGFYFAPRCRRFIRTGPDGSPFVELLHPSNLVIDLEVIEADRSAQVAGFIGLSVYAEPALPDAQPGFYMCGPTGNLRRDGEGRLQGDGIYAMYPRGALRGRRVLDYRPADPPYVVPNEQAPK